MMRDGRPAVEAVASVADLIIDPVLVFEAVRDGSGAVVDFRYEYVNAAYADYVALPAADIVGRTISDAGMSNGTLAVFRRVLDTGEPVTLRSERTAKRLGRRDDLVFEMKISRLGDGVLVSGRDPRERHAAEELWATIRGTIPFAGAELQRHPHRGRSRWRHGLREPRGRPDSRL